MRPLAGIALILMMALQHPGLSAQDLVVTKEGRIFLCQLEEASGDWLQYSFRYMDQQLTDSLLAKEVAYAGTNFIDDIETEPGNPYQQDLVLQTNGKWMVCKILSHKGSAIAYAFTIGEVETSTSIRKKQVAYFKTSFREELHLLQESQAHYQEVWDRYQASLPPPPAEPKKKKAIVGNEDLIHKVNGDVMPCYVMDIGSNAIRYQFPLGGKLVSTSIFKSEVYYVLQDQSGDAPVKTICTPIREEELTELIILKDGSQFSCFLVQSGMNSLEYFIWKDGAAAFQVLRSNQALYVGDDFRHVLNRDELESSPFPDLIVTKGKSVLLCDIVQSGSNSIRYSFRMNKRKVTSSINRDQVIYEGANFYRLALLAAQREAESAQSEAEAAHIDLSTQQGKAPDDDALKAVPEPLTAMPEVQTQVIQDELAPELVIASPTLVSETDFQAVSHELSQLEISGVVLDDHPTGILRVNGMEVGTDDLGKFVAHVDLEPGINRILLTARDAHGNETRQEYRVERERPKKIRTHVYEVDRQAPDLRIISPGVRQGMSMVRVSNSQKSVVVTGQASDASGVYEVLVNGRDAVLASSGDFSREVLLRVGENQVIVQATDLELNTTLDTFTVIRSDAMETAQRPDIMGAEDRYFALIIGVSAYPDPMIPNLDGHPTRDAERLGQLLSGQYTFEDENITLLLNPDRVEILKSFDLLSRKITPNDNLLIFFAGHGYYDEDAHLGYWLPSDAESEFTANWIYNDVLVANLKRIHSKHTLLISDACFSGSIFQTRSMNATPLAYKKKYDLPSRKAITSGVLEAVPAESVFFRYLADRLESNHEHYMSAGELFRNLEFPVANSSPNSPQYGTIQNVDDEGGDFIFIRR